MTRKTPLWRLAAVAGAAALVLAACGDDDGDDTAAPEDTDEPEAETTEPAEEEMAFTPTPLAIGSLLPQTGQLAPIVESLESAIDLAVTEINEASPGLITWDPADSGTDANVASENVDQFLTGDYAAFIGAAASGVSTAIVDKVQDAEVVMCSGSNTAASLSAFDPYYIRTAPSDDLQAPTLGDLIIADGHSSVAVIWRNDEYGVGFGEALADYLEAGGIEVPLRQGYDPQVTSFSDQISEVAGSGAQALAAITFEEGGQMVLDMQGVFDGQLYVADGFVDTVTADQLGGDATLLTGVRGTYPSASPATGEETFSDRFAAAFPDVPTIFSAHKYDCVVTIALAVQVAGSADPTVFVNEINGVTKDGTKCSLFAECLALIEAGEDIDYDGASGQLEFSDSGQPSAGTYDLFEYDAEGAQANFDQVETALE
jgi:branched-chain amino acid transport system substrate-binding protein